MTGPTTEQADVAIIIVSTNEAKWLEPCLRTVFEHAGDAKLDVVVVDNESTDGTRELVESGFPQARVVELREHGLRARQQPRRDDLQRPLRALPQPGHRDRRRNVRRARRGRSTRGRRSAWRASSSSPPTARCGRRSATSRASAERSARRSPPSAGRGAPRWAGERELDLAMYDTEVACDWTSGSFMFCSPRGAAQRRAHGRALLHLLRGARPLPAHEARRLDDAPPAVDDDRPSRRQGRRAPEDGRPGRLHAPPVRGQALRRSPARGVPRRGRRAPCRACDDSAAARPAHSAARRRASPCARSSGARDRPSVRRRGPRSHARATAEL